MEQNKLKPSIYIASVRNPKNMLMDLNIVKPSKEHLKYITVFKDEEYCFDINDIDFEKYKFYLRIRKVTIPIPSTSKKINPFIQIYKLQKENIRLTLKHEILPNLVKGCIKSIEASNPIDLIFDYIEEEKTCSNYVFNSNSFFTIPMGSDVGIIIPCVPENSKIDFAMEYEYIKELKEQPIKISDKRSKRKEIKQELESIKSELFSLSKIVNGISPANREYHLNQITKSINELIEKI